VVVAVIVDATTGAWSTGACSTVEDVRTAAVLSTLTLTAMDRTSYHVASTRSLMLFSDSKISWSWGAAVAGAVADSTDGARVAIARGVS
jgi:hypothetical protein